MTAAGEPVKFSPGKMCGESLRKLDRCDGVFLAPEDEHGAVNFWELRPEVEPPLFVARAVEMQRHIVFEPDAGEDVRVEGRLRLKRQAKLVIARPAFGCRVRPIGAGGGAGGGVAEAMKGGVKRFEIETRGG